jgi:hypothetical protein
LKGSQVLISPIISKNKRLIPSRASDGGGREAKKKNALIDVHKVYFQIISLSHWCKLLEAPFVEYIYIYIYTHTHTLILKMIV